MYMFSFSVFSEFASTIWHSNRMDPNFCVLLITRFICLMSVRVDRCRHSRVSSLHYKSAETGIRRY